LNQLKAWQQVIDENLPDQLNNPDYFGEQFIVDASGDYLASETRLLLNSVQISLEVCVETVHQLGGLAIPAHVNRKAFGLFANLGMAPANTPIDALEISRHISPADARRIYPQTNEYPLLQNGDVHHLDDFLGTTLFSIEAPTLTEIRLAIHNKSNRRMEIVPEN